MPQSLSRVALHLVFSTKDRMQLITNPVQPELNKYIASILKSLDCPAIIVESLPDHVHVLFNLSRAQSISKVVEEVKKRSSKWIKTKGADFEFFSWQRGYGVFSVSESRVGAVRSYIENQHEHHRKLSFQEEFIIFLKKQPFFLII